MKPITPEEVVSHKKGQMPEEIIKIINDLISQGWDGRSSSFKLKVLKKTVVESHPSLEIRDWYWDFEEIYRAAGWKVEYDRPGWDENYDSFFKFTKQTK